MAGITYSQVSAVADKMVAEGETPSIRSVRLCLGTGSTSTIQKHLKAWNNSLPQPSAMALTLSQSLTSAIISEIARSAAEGRANAEQNLVHAEADINELSMAVELLENERDELTQKLVGLQSERDTISGKSAKQEIDLALLTERIEREQVASGSAQVALAMEKLKLVDLEKRDAEHLRDIVLKSSSLDAESKARIIAEQAAAVLDAKLENALAQIARADARIDSLSTQLADTANELNHVRVQAQAQQSEHTANTRTHQEAQSQAQRAAAEAIQQVQRSSLATQEAINATKRAEREAAELRGRMDAMQERAKDGQAAK